MNFSDYKSYTQNALDSVNEAEVGRFIDSIFDAYQREATIYVIGNGGSAANASHLAQDLAKGTCADMSQQKRIRALSLTDNFAFFSALGNDEGYDQVFVQQLRTFARPGDVLVSISGSGNSPNVLRAVEYAKENGSFGLSTMRDRHVRIGRGKLRFEFRGKSGKNQEIDLHDPVPLLSLISHSG